MRQASIFSVIIVLLSLGVFTQQLRADFHVLSAYLDGQQANAGQGTGSPGTGYAAVTIDEDAEDYSAVWHVTWENLSSPVTGIHFHFGAPGQEGPIRVDVGAISGLTSPSIGATIVPNGPIHELMDGLWYINIHTVNFPDGEIRGQVIMRPTEAEDFTINLGSQKSGALVDLNFDDNQYLVMDPQFLASRYQLELIVEGTSHRAEPINLEFIIESKVFNFVGTVQQSVELFNYDSGQYEVVDTRLATSADSVYFETISTNPGRFVEDGTNAVKARIRFQNSLPFWVTRIANLYLPFRTNLDRFLWNVN